MFYFKGIDVPLNEIGEVIQETMESYEIEIDGKLYPSLYYYLFCIILFVFVLIVESYGNEIDKKCVQISNEFKIFIGL